MFGGGVDGAWYDPSDLSTLFKDVAGATPVTAAGDAVARVNDKSGNGHNLLQSSAGLRPIYRTSGGLSWLEFDGVDDTMSTSTIFLTLQVPSYIAACFSKGAENALSVFAVFKDASNYHRVINQSTSSRMTAAIRSTARSLATITSAGSSFPISTIKVADTLAVAGGNDIAINNGTPVTVANSWVATDTVAGCSITVGPAQLNFYGGIVSLSDASSKRSDVCKYLGALGGIAI
ncbi:hypothetical protein [Mesorhizobium sp. M0130]|uniref:hypothetical protein n=1 Tax=Mesorhizobium sp. M0130 TaxID=2956887 RepID=UPI003337E75F